MIMAAAWAVLSFDHSPICAILPPVTIATTMPRDASNIRGGGGRDQGASAGDRNILKPSACFPRNGQSLPYGLTQVRLEQMDHECSHDRQNFRQV